MRAALLPAGPDPFLLAYWLRNYKTWGHVVDELRIIVSGQDDLDIRAYLLDLASPHAIKFVRGTDHGQLIRELLEATDAEMVLLCEDDAFIRHPEKVDECFRRIERDEVDIIGCPRATGSGEILEWATRRYGDWQVEPTDEAGPLLWPCFLFAKRGVLLQTDRCFGAWGKPAGEPILGQVYETDQAMDTFGWTTLQLREMGCRIGLVPNYRAQLWGLTMWHDAPWFHVGGLSTGYGLYLADSTRPEYQDAVKSDPVDWGKRISWWKRVAEKSDGMLSPVDYLAAVNSLAGLIDTVPEWYAGFDEMINWQEQM